MSHPQQLARGMLWLGSATLLARLIDAGSMLLVFRVLSSAELGVATVALSVIAFVEGFNSLGINNALIQRSKVNPEQLASVWWYVLGVTLLMTAGMALAAPLVASLYDASELTPLVRVASLKLLFVGLASVPLALLNRDLRFREVGAIMTGATLLSASLTVLLASTGAGAWAPLAGNVAHGLFQLFGALLFRAYRPSATFAWKHVSEMARDGVRIAGAVSLGQLARNVDYLVLGKLASLNVVGSYRVALALAMMPSMLVLQVANRTSLPIYSRIVGDGGKLSSAFARTVRTVSLMIAPLLVFAAIAGDSLFELFDKPRVGAVHWAIVGLCVAAWLRGLSQCTPVLLIASGRHTSALVQAASSATLLAFGVWLALTVGADGDPLLLTASAWVIVYLLQLGVDYLLARPVLELKGRDWSRAVVVPAGIALLTAAAALILRQPFDVRAPLLAATIDAAWILAVYALLLRFGLKIRGFGELRSGNASGSHSA